MSPNFNFRIIPRGHPSCGVLLLQPVIQVLKKRNESEQGSRQKLPTNKPMKTTIKLATVISLLTMSLVTTSWASPRSKLSYEGPGYNGPSNYRVSSSHADHVWFKHVGPRSKM
jgi:hypothetical protein